MNLILRALIFASFIFESGFGLFGPVFAVFVTDQIAGGDVSVVGYAAGIYWILKSLFQIPIGRFLDKKEGEIDDFWALFVGHFIMGLVVLLYVFVETPLHLYLLHMLLAVGGALSVPSWYVMFMRHVDKNREGFEWSINSSLSFGLGTGGAGALGGFLAKIYGFPFVFVAGAILVWLSLILLLILRRELQKGTHARVPNLPHPL